MKKTLPIPVTRFISLAPTVFSLRAFCQHCEFLALAQFLPVSLGAKKLKKRHEFLYPATWQ